MFRRNGLYRAIALASLGSLSFVSHANDGEWAQIEEIEVTATRRSESIQDIPYNITAVTGDSMRDVGATSLSKMAQSVPGLQMLDAGARGVSLITLRGMNIGGLESAEYQGGSDVVSRYVNDSPLLVDLKLIDVARVEVLRGPQGTLYGRGAMGGTLRYVLNKPNVDGVEGEVYGKMSKNKESSDFSYEVTGIVNVPITDTLAARFSGSHTMENGFVDYDHVQTEPGVSNASRKVEDANDEKSDSFRGSLLWMPTEDFSVEANYFVQNQHAGGRRAVNEEFTGDKFTSSLRYLEPEDKETDLFSLTFDLSTQHVDIYSTTSKSSSEQNGTRDFTDFMAVAANPDYLDFPEFTGFVDDFVDTDVLVHETRFLSTGDGMIDWLVGIYFEDEDYDYDSKEYTPGYQEWAGIPTSKWGELEYERITKKSFEEKAIFGELTVHLTDDIQVTAGYREFEQTLTVDSNCRLASVDAYIHGDPDPDFKCDAGESEIKDNVGKLNASWNVTDDIMLYATWAEGFRRGGVNLGVPYNPVTGTFGLLPSEQSFNPDTTTSKEIGWHTSFQDGRATINGAIFQLDWEGLQVGANSQFGGFSITQNGEAGQIEGVELSLQYYISDSLRLNTWLTKYDTGLTSDSPSINGLKGDAFPGVPEVQYNVALEYKRSLGDGELTLNGNYYWKDEVPTQLNSTVGSNAVDYDELDSYGLVNLSAKYSIDQWNFKAYVDNAANKYYETGARGEATYGQRGSYRYIGTPRVMGLEVGYIF